MGMHACHDGRVSLTPSTKCSLTRLIAYHTDQQTVPFICAFLAWERSTS